MSRADIPVLFCFIVEGEGAIDVYSSSYGQAVEELERRVGHNVFGKFYLEKEIRNGIEYRRSR